jgi:hypothetical protein
MFEAILDKRRDLAVVEKLFVNQEKKKRRQHEKNFRLIPDGLIFHQLTHKTRIKI